ncbi:MAG: sulfate ABC transporter ATP-binding protein [Pseudomonadota bacterium]|nr:sulfate ABC transporter ATP-binding protein [Pseudomonadota bacterium]
MSIEIRNLQKSFGAFTALHGVDLDIDDGELMALLGPSGCGKTTLLRMIAGLETPDAGSIHLHGRDVTRLAARHRGVGFVFQHYALFRHMNVFENVAFGLRVRPRATRPAEPALRDKVNRIIDLVQLGGMAQRFPDQLSGGQRQRVALARALIIEPNVLLLDEPFGALDAQVRRQLRRWLRRLHDELHVTSVFVTHDQDEALDVADRIVLLNHGQIEQMGNASQLQDHPNSVFVSRFLGEVNHLPGQLLQGRVTLGKTQWNAPAGTQIEDGSVDVCVRPYDLLWSAAASHDTLTVTVTDARWLGGRYRIEFSTALEGVPFITAEWSRTQMPDRELASGDIVNLKPHRFALFARS